MRVRRRWLVGAMAVSLAPLLQCLLGTAGAAAATSTISGIGEWHGTVFLGTWPCSGSCTDGSFTGSFHGSFSGVDAAGNAYTVTFPDPTGPAVINNLSLSNWSYSEPCPPVPQSPPIAGSAQGFFAIGDGQLVDNGQTTHNATLSGNFGFLRALFAEEVSIDGLTLADSRGVTVATPVTPVGDGGGTFVPITVLVPPAGTCLAPPATMTATVAGSVTYEA